jgi:hypothetical protein
MNLETDLVMSRPIVVIACIFVRPNSAHIDGTSVPDKGAAHSIGSRHSTAYSLTSALMACFSVKKTVAT